MTPVESPLSRRAPAGPSPPPAVAGVESIRARFAALSRRHDGTPVAYFDGPAGTQVPDVAAQAVTDYPLRHNANVRGAYPTSRESDGLILAARAALADFVGGAPDEIVFGANMTSLTFTSAVRSRAAGARATRWW